MSTTIVIVEKTGVIKEQSVKNISENELYKKAGFKTSDGFVEQVTWNVQINDKKYNIRVYGKTSGRAGQENKYDFPPPIDQVLFFGSCVIVNKNEVGNIIDLTEKEWDAIYEYLFGGFEDIGDEDSEDEDEDEEDDDVPRTKEGYVKDGFIVDDDDDEEEDESDEESDEDEDEDEEDSIPVKKTKKPVKKQSAPRAKKAKSVPENVFIALKSSSSKEDTFLDCTSELCEEEYFA
jgi:hypothetical protein